MNCNYLFFTMIVGSALANIVRKMENVTVIVKHTDSCKCFQNQDVTHQAYNPVRGPWRHKRDTPTPNWCQVNYTVSHASAKISGGDAKGALEGTSVFQIPPFKLNCNEAGPFLQVHLRYSQQLDTTAQCSILLGQICSDLPPVCEATPKNHHDNCKTTVSLKYSLSAKTPNPEHSHLMFYVAICIQGFVNVLLIVAIVTICMKSRSRRSKKSNQGLPIPTQSKSPPDNSSTFLDQTETPTDSSLVPGSDTSTVNTVSYLFEQARDYREKQPIVVRPSTDKVVTVSKGLKNGNEMNNRAIQMSTSTAVPLKHLPIEIMKHAWRKKRREQGKTGK